MTSINTYSFWKYFQNHVGAILVGISILLFGVNEIATGQSNTNKNDESLLAQVLSSQYQADENLMSITYTNMYLKEALEILAKRLRVGLSYNPDIMPEKRVNFSMTNVPAHAIIHKLLEGTNLEAVLPLGEDVIILIEKVYTIQEQAVSITGRVTDSLTNETLPGVNILVKGTVTGAATDATGNFQLIVPSLNDTLIISYVGYRTIEEPINGRTTLNIGMVPLAITAEDIIVVGYGVQQQVTVTGAVASVNHENITAIPTGDVASRLAGRVAGARITQNHGPSGGTTVRIRGIGTIGNNDPLFVVDGIPVDNIVGLNPNSIESISVLKDAGSSAIYGSRASNGVVVITTNRGSFDTPLQVRFGARYGVQQVTNQLQLLSVQELGEKKWQELINDGVNVGDSGWGDLQYGFGPQPTIPDYVFPARASEGAASTNESLYNYGNPYYGITRANKEGTDWLGEIFDVSPIQEYSLNISGGTANTRFSLTGSVMENTGILIHTGYGRYNLSTNLDFRVTDNVQIGANLGSTFAETRGANGSGAINAALRIHPMLPVYDIMGNFAGTKSPGTGNQNNPVASQYRNKDDLTTQLRLLTSIFANVNIKDELSFRTSLGVDLNRSHDKSYGLANPEFTQTNFGNSYSESTFGRFQYNWANTLTYANTFNNDHSVNVLLGSEFVSNNTNTFNASRASYAFEDTNYMVLSSGEGAQSNSGSFNEWALFSYFSRINYDYQQKYLFEAVVRRDASSRFTGDYRWGTFPAISVGWRILEDLGSVSFIDDLKIRASWGQNGNDNVGNYNQYSTYISQINTSFYDITGSNNSVRSGFRAASIGNPNGRWETSTTTNFGIDISLIDYALQANLDFYIRNTTDMLYPDSQPATAGIVSRPDVNIGEMKNTGIDLMLTYRGNTSAGLSYSISGNISHYKNEVISLNNDPDEFQYGFTGLNDPATITRGGFPVSSFYGYIVDGIFNTQAEVDAHAPYNPNVAGVDSYSKPGMFKYRDVNGDGIIDSDDRTIIGNPHPDFTYGLNMDFRYRAYDMTLFFEGSYGNDIYNHVRREVLFNRYDGNFLRERLTESWTPERYAAGEKITVPITTNSDGILQTPSTFLVEDGSYFKLKNIQAGYTLPADISSRIGFRNLRVYVQATNVFTITKYSGLDPELSSAGSAGVQGTGAANDLSMGVDTSVYPTARILQIGININL